MILCLAFSVSWLDWFTYCEIDIGMPFGDSRDYRKCWDWLVKPIMVMFSLFRLKLKVLGIMSNCQ
jgi:hypothetical protein